MADVRPPAKAGLFYPASEKALRNQIEESFTHEIGPEFIPKLEDGERNIRGIVVPHAGYQFSGPVAAHAYGAIVEDGYPDVFVIIGPKHSDPFSIGEFPDFAITTETFKMPMGEVPVDKEIAERLIQEGMGEDPDMHMAEHSIEVQIPFLQYFESEIKFVPICVSRQDLETAKRVGHMIASAIGTRDIVIIASTDFTHCGPRYGQIPPSGKRVDVFAEEQDKKAIEPILDLNIESFYRAVQQNQISMCGYGCVASMLFALEDVAESAKLLKYATSYEIQPSTDAVGYGSIIIKQ